MRSCGGTHNPGSGVPSFFLLRPWRLYITWAEERLIVKLCLSRNRPQSGHLFRDSPFRDHPGFPRDALPGGELAVRQRLLDTYYSPQKK
jgi:hypothetical protein